MDAVNPIAFTGAEAEVRSASYHGRHSVTKTRVAKKYRNAELDARIRAERLRTEALLLAAARAAGVPVPVVYDADVARGVLEMERVNGPTLRQVLKDEPERAQVVLAAWGAHIGRLHSAGLVHGDLTTSNAILDGDRVVLIDFGLAGRSRDVEDHGVDLVLAQRTLESTHPRNAAAWFTALLDGYRTTHEQAEATIERMREIRGRARYV